MSDRQRQQLQTTYDSLDAAYQSLMTQYEANPDSMPEDLQAKYGQMQQMHQQMETNHQQMMAMNMGRHMQGNNMMSEGMGGMGMHMQGHMTGEWYQQMMSMHQQMAALHNRQGQDEMARMNRRLSDEYNNMMQQIPDLDEPNEVPFNEEGDPSLLNGRRLFTQNCAACHGTNARGIPGAFPPLVNSEWITGNKDIPIRILLNGLQGEIEVEGETYNGIMPSFKARLSAAEMAAILNYLRDLSDGDYPAISQQDVISVGKSFRKRTTPWSVEELNGN